MAGKKTEAPPSGCPTSHDPRRGYDCRGCRDLRGRLFDCIRTICPLHLFSFACCRL